MQVDSNSEVSSEVEVIEVEETKSTTVELKKMQCIDVDAFIDNNRKATKDVEFP